jgi:hypothetical protein
MMTGEYYMKRLRILFVFGSMIFLSGCIQEYNYSDEQIDQAAEYIAGLLLENDKDYSQSLIAMDKLTTGLSSDALVKDTASAIEAAASSVVNESALASLKELDKADSLAEVLQKKGIDLQYIGYKIMDSYPEDKSLDYFSITPMEGNQLVIINFMLSNTTTKKKALDLTKSALTYRLDVNNGTIYEPSFTVLKDDLKYLNTSLLAKEERPVILVVEIKKDTEIKDMKLMVSNGSKVNIIKMK